MNFAKHWAATLDDYVIDLAWSPDGTVLAAASASGGIRLFDAATGRVRESLAGHADGTNCLAWLPQAPAAEPGAPGILASGGQDGSVRLWDGVTGAQTAEAKVGSAWVEHLATVAAPTGNLVFAAVGRKLAALRPDGTIVHTFPEFPKTISALAVLPTGPGAGGSDAALVAAACFGHVRIFDATSFALRKDYAYANAIYALVWSPDRRWLVAGCHDNAVHLWAPAEELELHMSGYETRLKELSFSHDSKWLATGGGRDACIWDCSGAGPEGREPLPLPHAARVCAVAFQNAHSLLATADQSGVFTLWAPSRKNPMIAEVTMPAPGTRLAWRPDDQLLAVGTEKGPIYVFRTQ